MMEGNFYFKTPYNCISLFLASLSNGVDFQSGPSDLPDNIIVGQVENTLTCGPHDC